MKGFSSKRTILKADSLRDQKMYCLQAYACTFKPWNVFTAWGCEGVKSVALTKVS